MQSRWTDLPTPILALAPMEDVTDTVFRRLVRDWSLEASNGRCAGPAVMFTEFTRTDVAIASAAAAERGVAVDTRLAYGDAERPLVAQIWGRDPEQFRLAASALTRLGFDGIDINMGCPVRKIRRRGGGSALIEEPALAAELIAATREGTTRPVSVKTRIGVRRIRTEEWCAHLLQCGIDALTIHGRTAVQMSEGAADWGAVGLAVGLRNEIAPHTRILGNGDLRDAADAIERVAACGADGAMVGRAIFRDPLLFARRCVPDLAPWCALDLTVRLERLADHLRRAADTWDGRHHYDPLKKFFRNYLTGDGAEAALLERLYATDSLAEARRLLSDVCSNGASPVRII